MDSLAEPLRQCIAFVAKRDRTESQVSILLSESGYPPEVIEQVVLHLRSKNILNDLRFAQMLVRKWLAKGHGSDRIKMDLERQGVSDIVIGEVMSQIGTSTSELADALLKERMGKSSRMDRSKALRFLTNRGFSDEDVEQAVSRVFGSEGSFSE